MRLLFLFCVYLARYYKGQEVEKYMHRLVSASYVG